MPIRSWGRYPRRGTALEGNQREQHCELYSRLCLAASSRLPLIHILEHTTGSVGGGEDALVGWNSGG